MNKNFKRRPSILILLQKRSSQIIRRKIIIYIVVYYFLLIVQYFSVKLGQTIDRDVDNFILLHIMFLRRAIRKSVDVIYTPKKD